MLTDDDGCDEPRCGLRRGARREERVEQVLCARQRDDGVGCWEDDPQGHPQVQERYREYRKVSSVCVRGDASQRHCMQTNRTALGM